MIPYSEQERFKDFIPEPAQDTELEYFFSHAYHDMRFFLKSVTESNTSTFTYFGDVQRNLFYISDNMRDTFGFEHNVVEDLLVKWRDRIYGDKWKQMYDLDLERLLRTQGRIHDLRYQVADKDGKVFWIRCYGRMQWDKDLKKPLFFAGRIARQDRYFSVDPVTGFPVENTLQLRLAKALEEKEKFLTIGFSLNSLTQINTMHGRNAGDRLVKTIADRLMDKLIGKMTFYRLSGVRCLATVYDDTPDAVEALIGEIRSIVCDTYRELGFIVARPCAFAVMEFPQPQMSPADFIENMISLIKLACREPQQDYVANSPQNIEKVLELANMEMEITRDVFHGMENFRAVIQPVVSAKTGKIIAGETLMRWRYQGKDVSPGIFIPILEKTHLIYAAGRWIMEQAVAACCRIRQWLPDFYLTVNVSLQQLYDEDLLAFLPAVLEKYGLEGRHLVLEMTESSMDREPGKLRRLIDVCQGLGVRLALDDFGTGYSSLRVLLEYNTNVIKLDRSLLLEMTQSQDKSNFISSIVYACHQFGKTVCMEGVENDTQRQLVVKADCDMIQGFYYYRPTELETVFEIIRKESAPETAAL